MQKEEIYYGNDIFSYDCEELNLNASRRSNMANCLSVSSSRKPSSTVAPNATGMPMNTRREVSGSTSQP